MANTLTDSEWRMLIDRIKRDACVPFLGAGACHKILPLASEIADKWASEHNYPLLDRSLTNVAQYLAVTNDPVFPKQEIADWFATVEPPNFREADEPHGALANLRLPVYITTNYDAYMTEALKAAPHRRNVVRELCYWHPSLEYIPSRFTGNYKPSSAEPVVFHLHGHTEAVPSLVLTEDDYIDFLYMMTRNPNLLPAPIREALTHSTCLFVGYGLADLDFRVLFQSIRGSLSAKNFAVFPPPGKTEEDRLKAQAYLNDRYHDLRLSIFWGSAREFSAELNRRWLAADG